VALEQMAAELLAKCRVLNDNAELAVEFPEQAKALDDIIQAYVENRFGRRPGRLGLFEEATVLKARCSVYDSLLQRLGLVRKLFSRR